MREIVGGIISGGTITNNFKLLIDASRSGRLVDVYDRKQMQFMASCDLGRNWELMASGHALFVIDDDGNCHMPNAELCGCAAVRTSAELEGWQLQRKDAAMNKPKCAVRGMVRPGAMCSSVIVGGKFCGHAGECKHKIPACEYCEGTGVDPESFRSPIELPCPACKEPSNANSASDA